MLNRSLLALFVLLALVGVAPVAHAATGLDDFVCETTTTAGTGTVDLAGALTGGYIGFIAAPNINTGDTIKYRITTGTGASKKIETGTGVVTDASPDTLTRVPSQTTDDVTPAITALTLSGTSTVCLNWGRDNALGDKGDITISNGFDTFAVDADSVALTTDTTGSYAAGDAEAGAALTGDSATSFFSAGTLEDARITGSDEADEVLNSDKGDFTCTTGSCTIDGDAVALTTDTSGNYAAGDAEAGAALTGDSATAFFSAGTIEDARISGSAEADEIITGDLGEITCSGGASCTHDADTVALTTDTTGNYAAGDAEAGAALTGDSATSFFSTGTLGDAQVDGSAEADEVNPTLGTQTQGNFVNAATGTAVTGIAITHTPSEGSSVGVAFDFTDKGADPSLSADTCVFSGDATTNGEIVCEGDTANTSETRIVITEPTGDRSFTIPDANSFAVVDRDYGDITASASAQTWTIDADTVALTTDTTGSYAAGDAEAGAALTGDSATSFFSTGTLEDARIDGSAEADEVNPTLGTQTQGNFVNAATGAATTGIAITHTPSEGSSVGVALDYTDKGADPALAADTCVFNGDATSNGEIVCEGDTADTIETRIIITDPTASDKTFTIPNGNSAPLADGDKGDITVGSTGTDFQIDADAVGANEISAGAVGTSEAAALDAGDVTTGTFTDAQVSGSNEADELTLAGDVDGTANSNDIDEANVEAELESVIDEADLQVSDQGTDPALATDRCAYTTDATTAGNIVCEGDTANTAESRMDFGDPSADRVFTLPDANSYPITDKDYGDITASASGQTWAVDADSIALTTDTTGNYAAGDAEAGAALTGDSATSFFSGGTIEDARIDGSAEADEVLNSDKGDFTCTTGSCTIDGDAVALTTDTTGNYAAGDAEAGAALTGDSATSFFSAGTIEDARIDGSAEADEVLNSDKGDFTCSGGTCGIDVWPTFKRQVVTGTSTYTPTAGAMSFKVRCQAAGGGGGGSDNTGGSAMEPGAGGGGGQYAEIQYTAAQMGADAAVTIGAIGTAGSNDGGAGGAAGDVVFNPAGSGGTLTVDGGGGGDGSGSANTSGYYTGNNGGGGGNVASGGDFEVDGQPGEHPYWASVFDTFKGNAFGGNGGDGVLGSGGRMSEGLDDDGTDFAGVNGQSYGGGGSGAADDDTTGSAGGAGGPGICIIDELLEG